MYLNECTACLTEKTTIHWFGQKIQCYKKTRGVKQGCPISPLLFTIALNAIIETVVEVLENYNINGGSMELPLILAYADDLIILSENSMELDRFVNEFVPTAESLGLSLNEDKSLLLIRNPLNTDNQPTQIRLGAFNIQTTNKMKYLGI